MNLLLQDLTTLMPLMIIAGGILLALVIEMYYSKARVVLPWITALILLITAYYSIFTIGSQALVSPFVANMLNAGGTAHLFYFIFNFGGFVTALLSMDYIKKLGINFGEFYILLLSAILGMMLIAAAKDLVMVFIGLEQMSIPFYILAGINRKNVKANEASMKYFLLGAFATGFIVYGMALMFGSAQTLNIPQLIASFPQLASNAVFIAGVLLFLVGFSFKVAAVPFHMWVPDVYQGAPTVVTALMSTGGKAAAFSAILLLLPPVVNVAQSQALFPVIAVLSLLSMLFGSIVAIAQSDIKRMLAYSSIAHAGYMLIGVASGSATGAAGVIFYLAGYSFMNLGAFGAIAAFEKAQERNLALSDYAGLSTRSPLLAAVMALFMFALSGLPPFVGFFGKYYVFIAAIQSQQSWLAIAGVISSVISVYFYLRVIVLMYFKTAEDSSPVTFSGPALLGILITALLVVLMGIMPGSLIDLIAAYAR